MNAFYFYPTVAGSLLAALTFRTTPPSPEKRAADRSAALQEVETTWMAAEDDADRYRAYSMQEIEAYAVTLRALISRSEKPEFASRDYLRTRLQSLREHIDYAREEALKLPSSRGEDEFIPAHARFHRTLTNLKGAFAETANELANGA